MGFGRAVIAIIGGLVIYRTYWLGERIALIDGVNLVFHEAGHVFFAPLGRLWGVAGGSLFEAGLPLSLALIALWNAQWTPFGGCCVWLSTALHSISVYAADARARELPLLGGEAVIHDWWYLLRAHGQLAQDQEIAGMIWTAGVAAAAVGALALIAGVLRGTPPVPRYWRHKP